MGMTSHAYPTSHAVAVALDEYLALTCGPVLVECHTLMRSPAEAFAVADEVFAFYDQHGDNVPPAVRALSRLRFEAACEVERLLRLLDAIDADPDLEISDNVDGNFAGDDNGLEPNFATTPEEDATGAYVDLTIARVKGMDRAPDELELVCEDEGAQCDDEGSPDDNGIADQDGRAEQWPFEQRVGHWEGAI